MFDESEIETSEIEAAARALIGHRESRTPNPVATYRWRTTALTTGYRIQAEMERILVEERGGQPIGYKIAATNAAARAAQNLAAPFFGRLYQATTTVSPATIEAGRDFFRLLEPEIALRIGRTLRPAMAPFTAADIAAVTHSVLPALEIVGTAFAPWAKAGAPNLAADNAAHGFWIMGMPITDFERLDLVDAPITLSIDGVVQATGAGRAVDGGAFGATAWLANELAAMGRGLRVGDYVTTGSVVPPWPMAPNQHVVADFGPLGRIDVTIGA